MACCLPHLSILSSFLSAKHSLVMDYRNMASDQPREDHDAYPYPNNSVVLLPNTHSPPFASSLTKHYLKRCIYELNFCIRASRTLCSSS